MSAMRFVIECEFDVITVLDADNPPDHTLEWRGDGVLIYLKGKFNPTQYAQACNLVNNLCQDMHIPLYSVRRVKRTPPKRGRDTETKRMF